MHFMTDNSNNKNQFNWPCYLQFDSPMMSPMANPLHNIPIKLQLISFSIPHSHFITFLFKLSNHIPCSHLAQIDVAGYSAVTPEALYSVV